jgi:ankyrin repeat protein
MATTASVSPGNLVINYTEQLPLLLCQFSASGDLQRIQNILPQLKPQDISRGDYDNRTPLHLAAEEGNKFFIYNPKVAIFESNLSPFLF